MIGTSKWLAIVAVAFVAGSFIASPELRAFAANTVGSSDIINNSIQSVDIKDAEVKTADLGGDVVTSAKIKDGEIKSADIANAAVQTTDLGSNAVNSAKIKDGEVMTSDLANNAVTSDKLADNVFDNLQNKIDSLEAEVEGLKARVETLEGGSSDPNVDDDGDSYSETEGDCNDDNPTINPNEIESLNAVDDNCDGLVDNVEDPFEPNDSSLQPAVIGEVVDDMAPAVLSINATMNQDADEDWYNAIVKSSPSDGTPHIGITVTLTNIPAGSNYDLVISCPDNCIGDDVDTFSSTQPGNADETTYVDEFSTSAETITLLIEVRNVSDTASLDEYTLTITAD
jgi:hypothetical protein